MFNNKKISVVIPAFNEEASIKNVILNIPSYTDYIIVVDDGSTDKTKEIAEQNGAIVVSHNKNKGVGAAFNTGLQKSIEMNADIMVNIDADGQFNPQDITKLIEPIDRNKAEFVTASRFKDPLLYPEMTFIKFAGNKMMSYFISSICGQKFYDVSCGFRAYSKNTLLRMNLFGDYTYTQESFIDLAHKKVIIEEVPLKIRGIRQYGKSKVASNLLKYGFRTLNIILKTLRDYNPLKLFGYLGIIFLILGCELSVFLFTYYFLAGTFSPHKWAGFMAGFFITVSILLAGVGFIMDMFSRMRMNQEEIMFQIKSIKKAVSQNTTAKE